MKRIAALLIGLALVVALPTTALASSYTGWTEIRACFEDGQGQELVVPDSYSISISGDTEWAKVMYAMDWVHNNITYEADETEEWMASDQEYPLAVAGTATGDCEDYAILLCALLRFNIGIPADRVWVEVGVAPGAAGHAWVGYRSPNGILIHLDPTWGAYYVGSIGGGMLRFNDEWVKGGGYFLHNPNLLE